MPSPKEQGKIRAQVMQWLREPLLQFLLIGIALFLISGALNHRASQGSKGYDIALTMDDLRQVHNTFRAQWEREPSAEEMRGLVEQRIREEILYREGLQLGLDKDDVIIRRRLAQKMQFLSEDVSAAYEPKSEELKLWYEKNSQRFSLPATISFRHLYLSPDRRGRNARQAAANTLAKIASQPEDSKTADLADPFMFQNYYRGRSADQLTKEFGTSFAQAVLQLKPGSWQGPIESGYGWHLVWIESITPGRIPNFEEVEPDVKTAWLADQKSQQLQKAYDKMRTKYQVLLPDPPTEPSSARMHSLLEVPR
jgi:parvulin-like peptidyl-prolyl isomerase